MTGDCCVPNSFGGKHLKRFQSETSVFKFLRCSIDWDLNDPVAEKFRNGRVICFHVTEMRELRAEKQDNKVTHLSLKLYRAFVA